MSLYPLNSVCPKCGAGAGRVCLTENSEACDERWVVAGGIILDGAPSTDPLQSYAKFDGVGLHEETIETRARIGESYLEAYASAVSDPLLKGYAPMDCPSELLLDLLERLRATEVPS